jgi:hypothetical protein
MLGLLVASMLSQVAPWGTGESRGEDLTIWLVTFGPGEDIAYWWGHSALVVEDGRLHQHRLYNYGQANFTPAFVLDFLKGRMDFWVADTDAVIGTYEQYKGLNRDVRTQELNLTPEQRALLAKALADNVLPQNRGYLYHHYNDNCSTRPRDLIDKAFGGQLLKATAGPARMSLRDHTRRYTRVSPVVSFALDFLQNNELDRPITQREEAFLPDELERQLNALKVVGPDGSEQPAVKRQSNYFLTRSPAVPLDTPRWELPLFLAGCALGGLGLFLSRAGRKGGRGPRVAWGLTNALLGLAWGTLSTLGFVLMIFTNNQVTHHNENLLLISPLALALLPLGVMRCFGSNAARTGLRWAWTALLATGVLEVLLKVLPMFDQANWNVILFVLPVSAMMAAATWLEHRSVRR